ncbi:MAG: 2-oxo acid dehydrogenase subunit E2, partial [Caldisericum exile]
DNLKNRVKEDALKVDDLTGSTFTITNLGMMRTDFFTPVLNGKEVAILGIGRVLKEPVIIENQIVVREFAYFSLSYDHRIVDGADAARFLGKLAEYIEQESNLQKLNKI